MTTISAGDMIEITKDSDCAPYHDLAIGYLYVVQRVMHEDLIVVKDFGFDTLQWRDVVLSKDEYKIIKKGNGQYV